MTLLAINWAETGIKAAQFIFSFSIIVVLHEFGHFLPARWFGCRIEKFYLFFNPWFSLFKKKIGDTEWGLGWIPFGGYVKISGMIDESMDKEAMKLPPKPYEFRSKPAWQRLIIMVGGVIVNLVLGFFIYAMMAWHWGEEYIPSNGLKYGIEVDSLGQSIGLQNGDQIVSVDGKYVEKFRNIPLNIILKHSKTIEVERNGEQKVIQIPDDFASTLIHFKAIGFISYRYPFEKLDTILPDGPALKAGLKKGDKILSYNGVPSTYYSEFRTFLRNNKGKPVSLQVLRGTDTLAIASTIAADGKFGIGNWPDTTSKPYVEKKLSYTLAQSFPAGLQRSKETLQNYWLQLKLIFSGRVKTSESLGSVFSIAKMYSPTWDWEALWAMTAFFSLVLALMNILPIPALDGGHALFTLIEMITGRKPSDKFIEYAQTVGMVLLMGLMAYALGLDIFRMFK
ncbi:MAG: RIP metalloprotease RseP [Chitinophagaceae bacterium]